jgi:hypothetical protein
MSYAPAIASDGIDSLVACLLYSVVANSRRIMSRYEDVAIVARVAKQKCEANIRLRSATRAWGTKGGVHKRSTLLLLHPQNSSKGLDRSETPCTRDSVQLLPTRRRFEVNCNVTKCTQPPRPRFPAKFTTPPGHLIVSEVDKGSSEPSAVRNLTSYQDSPAWQSARTSHMCCG